MLLGKILKIFLLISFFHGCISLLYEGKKAKVLGAGVIGLTNAIMLQKVGFKVTIHAKTSPLNYDPVKDSDPYYTSAKSGGWIFGDGTSSYYESTYDAFVAYSKIEPGSGVGIFLTQMYFVDELTPGQYDENTPFKDYAKKFRNLTNSDLHNLVFPNGTQMFKQGVEWATPIATPFQYLQYLMQTFLKAGGIVISETVHKISDLTKKVDLVVISPGLGAKYLGELNDSRVVSNRGQMIVVQQPADPTQRITLARYSSDYSWRTTCVIPRANGEILLGGTYERNVEDFTPSPTARSMIWSKAKLLEPKLSKAKFLRDMVGLRPGFPNGPRIELDNSFSVPVVYAYGHDTEGYEGSWGTALKVLDIISHLKFN